MGLLRAHHPPLFLYRVQIHPENRKKSVSKNSNFAVWGESSVCCTMRRYAIIVGMISCFETMQSDWLTKDPVCFHFFILLRKYKLYPKIFIAKISIGM